MADIPAIRPRTLVSLPEPLPRGQAVPVRVTLGHAMENGLRHDGYGNVVPRDLVTRFEARLDGALVFAADLFPAIAANPFLEFWMRAEGPGVLSLEWTGDRGYRHRETRALQPT